MHLIKDQEKLLNERGASMLEYAMMAALIAVVCIAGVTSMGRQVEESYTDISSQVGGVNDLVGAPVGAPPPPGG